MSEETRTLDDFLGGKIVIEQEARGYHRSGHDAVFLAAACPIKPGDTLCDLGAASGAAGLCVSARVQPISVVFLEKDPHQAKLCTGNIERKENSGRLQSAKVVVGDVEDRKSLFERNKDLEGAIDHLICNPPFRLAQEGSVSPHDEKKRAHVLGAEGISAWIKTASRLLKKRGTATFIFPASRLDMLLQGFSKGFGGFTVRPLYPLPGKPAHRVIVSAVKEARGHMVLAPGVTLEREPGEKTDDAVNIERFGAGLTL